MGGDHSNPDSSLLLQTTATAILAAAYCRGLQPQQSQQPVQYMAAAGQPGTMSVQPGAVQGELRHRLLCMRRQDEK